MEESTPIQKFYKDQTIFITGGTGFIGKVLIEKLLRTCLGIKMIYIMVRAKKGKTADQRFSEIFDFPCFDPLKLQMPNFVEKVRLISGNCQEPGLGLSHQDREILKRETTVVIHAAANVRFDQELRLATQSNIKCVEDILQLSKEMGKLKALVHVSTAYANCHQKFIDEKFYEPGMKAESLYSLLESIDDDTLEAITPDLIKKWPNTYTYTKCVAEDLIRREGKDLPVAIVRPSIILSTLKEPVPGWADNFYGLIGCGTGVMLGVIKNINADKNNVLHCVPCDFVVNNIIASAWYLQKQRFILNEDSQRGKLVIYNYVGSHKKKLTLGALKDILDKCKWKYPTSLMIWFPSIKLTKNKFWCEVRIFVQHTLVSYILDFILICLGKKPMAFKKIKQVNTLLRLISPFALKTWHFEYNNVERMSNEMTEKDREIFKISMEDFDWIHFWSVSIKFGRLYLLNEPLEKTPLARRNIKFFAILHYTVTALFWYLFFKLILFLYSIFLLS